MANLNVQIDLKKDEIVVIIGNVWIGQLNTT